MTALPASVLPRVASLVRLLSSPVDGEALAACRALDRTLRGAGADLHTLAAVIERPAPPAADPKRQAPRKPRKATRPRPPDPPPSRPPPPPRQPHRPDLVQLGEEQRAAIVAGLSEAVEDAEARLTEWQRTFARNVLDTVGRRRLCPTERQLRFIEDIVRTVRGDA